MGPRTGLPATPEVEAPKASDGIADEFDQWLDRSLRDLFAAQRREPLPPEMKALIEPTPFQSKRAPVKRK